MTDILQDPVGYDDDQAREYMRGAGTMMLGYLVISAIRRVDPNDGPNVCSVCQTPLGPWREDDNHHRSIMPPVVHYCAAHCPSCNRSKTSDDFKTFIGFMLFGNSSSMSEPDDDQDDSDDDPKQPPPNDGFWWS